MPWYYKGVGYNIWFESEGFPLLSDDSQHGDHVDKPDGAIGKYNGSRRDNTSGSNKGGVRTDTSGKTSNVMSSPAVTTTAPSSTPTPRVRFGSFTATLALSRLWSDRVEKWIQWSK